jgi:23S rRNA (pseudouridine1915-N3)-methyltransferase
MDQLVLLDEKGKSFSSADFSNFLNQKLLSRTKRLVFVIGGAFGFSEEVYKRTDFELSISKMTFSHQMIRLIFKEQLYRAFTILKGEKYHHE